MSETPTLRERMQADLKTAMLAGDVATRDALRFLMSAVKNAEIDKRADLTEAEGIQLLQKQAKRIQESIEQFEAGGRTDLADKERGQLAVLKRYLPSEMSDDEVHALVAAAIAETGASSVKDLGRVMPIVVERAAGRADGKRLSGAVRAALGAS